MTWAKVEKTLGEGKLFGLGAPAERVADLAEAQKLWAELCSEPLVQWVVEA